MGRSARRLSIRPPRNSASACGNDSAMRRKLAAQRRHPQQRPDVTRASAGRSEPSPYRRRRPTRPRLSGARLAADGRSRATARRRSSPIDRSRRASRRARRRGARRGALDAAMTIAWCGVDDGFDVAFERGSDPTTGAPLGGISQRPRESARRLFAGPAGETLGELAMIGAEHADAESNAGREARVSRRSAIETDDQRRRTSDSDAIAVASCRQARRRRCGRRGKRRSRTDAWRRETRRRQSRLAPNRLEKVGEKRRWPPSPSCKAPRRSSAGLARLATSRLRRMEDALAQFALVVFRRLRLGISQRRRFSRPRRRIAAMRGARGDSPDVSETAPKLRVMCASNLLVDNFIDILH